jgi:serine/threonine protein kinase/tetratricopeptide (TPR) repeat protein
MVGQSVGQYKITSELGQGGMGIVYLATDTKLDRQVALKFLPEPFAAQPEVLARFEREARAAAALNHPNIVTIYEIGEHNGRPHIAMEYVPGQTLRAYREHGALTQTAVLEIVRQVASGLARAHDAGITHRDLKPDNILITEDGIAKIVDFGLAQIRGSAKLTQTGSTLGTAAYMSPEQIEGKDVDHRSDIWSLGVIFYELLTGHAPFARDYQQAMMYAILSESPERPSQVNSEISPRLEQIVIRMLEKKRDDRYANFQEMLDDLATIAAAPVAPVSDELGIVVLPFEDISPGHDNEYFSDGLTEEIIADLSKITTLRVISRTSAMLLKGTDKDVRAIGRLLDVGYVLEGSVRKAGNNLRITAQLIEAAGDRHVWADKYSGSLDDIFAIQENVSRAIVAALKLTLTPGEVQTMGAHPIGDARAYDCFLRARNDIMRWDEEALTRALRHLQNGLEIVGENALLYAAMGSVYYQFVNCGARQDDYIKKAEEFLEKAFALDPESSHAHRLCGTIYQAFKGDQQKASDHYQKALATDPNDPDTLFWAALGYGLVGRIDVGQRLADHLLEIDPLTPTNHCIPGWLALLDGRMEDACDGLSLPYEKDPSNSLHRFSFVLGLIYAGRTEDALQHLDCFVDLTAPTVTDRLSVFMLCGLRDDKERALLSITDDLITTAKRDPQWSWHLAVGYTLIQEHERALDWLDNAVSRGLINYIFLSEHERFLDPLRRSERFVSILGRAETAWKDFRV